MMALNGTLMETLLTWVNSLKVAEPIERLSQMQDLDLLIRIVMKLNGKTEESPQILKRSLEDRLTFLQRHCRCGSKTEDLVRWEKIVQGENSEVEICKVIVLLFYISNMKSRNAQDWESFDHKTQTDLAAILRFVLDNEENLSLDDKLIRFLQRKARIVSSSDSASSSDETMSPHLPPRQTQVRFLELHRVASSSTMKSLALDSPSSPMSEVFHMPQFQIRRLRKQIVEGQEIRDELELELSETRKRLAEKEAQIFLMQQRIERLVVLNEKQADQQEPQELEELREKNESLMIRLRDALKQCQDMKTERSQLERKNDQLSEENGDLSYKVRDLSSRLAQLQGALNEITEEHEASLAHCQQQHGRLENELSAAVAEKKCLEEHIQILEGKISMLEDQIKTAGESGATGESMGDILKLENLQQEVLALNSKSMALQAHVARLEEEKSAAAASFESQCSRLESEKLQLQDIVTNLQTSLSEITFQKERQEQEARQQEEKLTCQITTLKLEITKLKSSLAQKDKELAGLARDVEEERKQRTQLAEALQRQEASSRKTMEELGGEVDRLGGLLKTTESKLLELTEQLSSGAQQMASLQQQCDRLVMEKDSALTALGDYTKAKEEELCSVGRTLQALQAQHEASLAAVEELKREKAELALKVQELDATILDLIAKCQNLDLENEAQSKTHGAALEALRTQLAEREAQLEVFKQKASSMAHVGEENSHIKEQLSTLEDTVRSLSEQLESEKRYSASLEGEKGKNSKLVEDMNKLIGKNEQALADVDRERLLNQNLESELCQTKEELRTRTLDLQQRVSSASDLIRLREEEIEKLTREVAELEERVQNLGQVDENLQNLQRDHDQVCRRLEEERTRVAELEARAETATSAQLHRVSELESALSAARTRLEEKEAEERKLLHEIRATEEKLRAAQQEKAERVSQLEASCSSSAQDLQRLSKELSDETLKKEELDAALKKAQKQNSERVATLEAEVSAMRATIKEREEEAEKLVQEVERFQKLVEDLKQTHRQELVQKDMEASRLAEDKEKAIHELGTEQSTKMEVTAQLQKSLEGLENECSALQDELSRSLDLVAAKEGEVQRLAKEMSTKERELHQEKEVVAKLSRQVETLKPLEEQLSAREAEIQRHVQSAKAAEVEIAALKAAISEREQEVQSLERDIKCKIEDSSSIHERYQATVGDVAALTSKIAELERKCREEEDSLTCARKEAADAKTAASEMSSASAEQQRRIQELTAEIRQESQKTAALAKQLEESRASQAERDASLEALKKELFHKVRELEQSQKSLSESSKELSDAAAASREQEESLAEARRQIARYQEDIAKTAGQTDSVQEELKNMAAKLATSEKSYLEIKKLLERETERNLGLENRLKVVQDELEASSKELMERRGAVQSLSTEASNYRGEAEKHKQSIGELQMKLSTQEESITKLEQAVRTWQEKCAQKEEQVSGVQQQLDRSQSLLVELDALRSSHAELTAEQARREAHYQEELQRTRKTSENLQVELEKTKVEVASLVALKGALEALQLERDQQAKQVAVLQEDNQKLAEENKSLSQASSKDLENMQKELAKLSEKHRQEMESVRLQCDKAVSEGKEQVQELSQKLEAVTSKYDHAKSRVLDERQKFQEEKQKLLAQVEQMEGARKVQSEQVQELNKKLSQQEKTIHSQQEKLKRRDSETHDEAEKQQKRLAELEAQLQQQIQAVEHYKAQMEKAKLHYDAKKEQNQELSAELQSVTREQEQLRKENADIKLESERLAKELQLSLLQTKEAEQSCKTLSSQVRSLEAQVEFADRQLRELGKFQVTSDAMKSRETLCPARVTRRSQADVSIDSLDMSDEDDHPMNSTRKNGRSHQEPSTSGQSISPEVPAAAGRLPRKVESLESLYFTPIPNRAQSKMDASLGSIGDLSLDSSKKTRSARRRTTQVINITMTKKTKEEVEPESANTSFYSLRSALSHQSLHPPSARRGRPQTASSVPAITSLPSQESLAKSERTSSDDSLNNSILMNLPGYRPNTRSSARLSQAGGRSSFYMSTCQDEPDPQEDWTRIAELQQRNRACPPHLKTSYPLESRPSLLSSTITDEEVKMGDPRETMRRATLLPTQIRESLNSTTRRKTLAPVDWSDTGVTTRQQVKRVTEDSHYGPDTPESKKPASCFPRPMTPKDRTEARKMAAAESKASLSQQSTTGRRQSMAFTILSTPKKLGNSLLKRGLNKKTTPKIISQGRKQSGSTSSSPHLGNRKSPSRKSPRGSTAKSPKTSKFFERKQSRNK